MKHKKVWLVAIIVVIAFAQATFVSGFSYINKGAVAQNETVVAILKESYVYVRVSIMIQGGTSVRFSNGTEVQLKNFSTHGITGWLTFIVTLPGTNYLSSPVDIDTGYVNVTQFSPIGIVALSNGTSQYFPFAIFDPSGYFSSTGIDAYWFVVEGNASVVITGYGMAL